jgi:hypothetical protein
MALGALIHRAERRHQQHVAQLMRARTLHNPGARIQVPPARAHGGNADRLSSE